MQCAPGMAGSSDGAPSVQDQIRFEALPAGAALIVDDATPQRDPSMAGGNLHVSQGTTPTGQLRRGHLIGAA